MKGRMVVVGVLLAALVVTGAWASEEKGSEMKAAASGEPIKIGALFAVTGRASWLGEPEKNTALMIAEEINAKGGIEGRPLEVIIEDTEGIEATAVNAMKKLIKKDNVLAVIGPSTSGVTMAVVPIAQEEMVPLISCAAAAGIVTPVEERKWVFKTPQMDADCVIRIYEHMKSKGISKIGIITGTTGFGKGGRDQLKTLAPEMGIEILADETYAPTDTDMTAQLTKIKAKSVQAIVNWSIGPTQSIVPKNIRQLGMTIPVYQSHGFGNIKYAQEAGQAAEGIIFPAGRLLAAESLPDDHPQKQLLLAYKKDYEAKFGDAASTFGGHAYDALHLVVEAIKKGGPTREGIRDGLEKIQGYVGTAGIFNLSPTDHVGLDKKAFAMLTVKDGKFTILED
ncbi:MAG: ABC transporter substrate-binding protein [Sedimentisphaerales bacterium]|nr:ABC transporter substrate-binding protein [Sedimentisphaerales bacterium]